jgi:D-glycero-alpha-D-manno-heptose-7-phosphate kinase
VIITSSPVRISLGGGTDLPSYYREHTGFLIVAAINKYVYINLHEPFSEEIIVKYSKLETARTADEVKHPIVREALKLVGIDEHPHLEIASMADIPAGTGLGSSGSFTTALLRALHCMKKNSVPARELAEQACHNRTRPAPGADRQTGPVHRGHQRPHLLHLSSRRAGWKSNRCDSTAKRSTAWKTT